MASPSDLADALIAEGNRAEDAGRLVEACDLYRKAVAAAPRYAKAQLNLGIGLDAAGDADGASEAFEAALAVEPDNPFANYNFGSLLFRRGEPGRAEERLRHALRAKPGFPEAQVALSNVLDARGDFVSAAAALEAALRARPDYVGALYSHGAVLAKLRRPAQAEAALRRAIALDPRCLPAYEVLGGVLRGQSRIDEALDCFGAARRLAPEKLELESAELFTLNFSERISADALFQRHKAFGERLERTHPPRFRPFRNTRDPERRLRVGYLSGDLWRHPVSLFLIPVLERHDRKAFEARCYSTGTTKDEVTQALADRVDAFRDVASLSDDEVADAVHADGVDILVDLSGHSGVYRLGVFAQQPSPVQAAWLGYLNTTGLTRIQYRISDRHCDPEGLADAVHTEKLVRLPHSQWCYRPFIADSPLADPPAAKNGFVTFGSFNHVSKISAGMRKLWAAILERVPDSRLVLAGVPPGPAGERLLADLGAPAGRITALPHAGLDQYLRSIGGVDIALDTTPYSGGTTTCDALWMGVPVLTLAGSRSISRSAASVLATVGLPEWIAPAAEDYMRLAVEFARDQGRLAGLRGGLREKMRLSPIMDEAGFVRDLENAYRAMWRAWCEGDS
ncbi:MAG TPA: tetratricopeptide repeat protein [Burkholderiales bacterium]|nr:tetratricopeptide repeat protein [Burkholderiales bacterium]HYA47215.1 tetratricopeptide repeat protein [Burkholderiales bacterium]